MKLDLSEKAVQLLSLFLLEPHRLPLVQAGMTKGQGVPNVYMTPDRKTRKQLEFVQKWMREVVLEPVDKEGDPKCEKGFKVRGHSGFLKNSYCDYVCEILKHYEPVGNLTEHASAYAEIEDNFSGRPHKLDSLSSATAPDEDEKEPANISKLDDAKKEKEA